MNAFTIKRKFDSNLKVIYLHRDVTGFVLFRLAPALIFITGFAEFPSKKPPSLKQKLMFYVYVFTSRQAGIVYSQNKTGRCAANGNRTKQALAALHR